MPVLKYKLNGEWITLSGGPGGGGSVEVDPSLSVEGMAADAKATGEMIAAIAEAMGGMATTEFVGEVVGALTEYVGGFEAQIAGKQNQVIFNTTQPANWSNGDIWLKPAE